MLEACIVFMKATSKAAFSFAPVVEKRPVRREPQMQHQQKRMEIGPDHPCLRDRIALHLAHACTDAFGIGNRRMRSAARLYDVRHGENPATVIDRRYNPRSSIRDLSSQSPVLSTLMKASWGMLTLPKSFIFFLPSFCFSNNLRLRVMSPP